MCQQQAPRAATGGTRTNHAAGRRDQRGLSLVEVLVALAVVLILLGEAVPTLRAVQDRRALEASAAQLETDLQLARSAAVAGNGVVRLDLFNDAGASCYVLHDGPAGACRCDGGSAPVCTDGTQALRSAGFAAGQPVQLRANVRSIAFDPVKGTITPTATLGLRSTGHELRLIVNVMGRVRSCAVDGTLLGHRRC